MMNDRSRRWQVLWMLAGALIFGGVLGCAGMYVVLRMSSAAYTDRFVRFVAHGPDGDALAQYSITLSPDDVAGFPQEIILFVEGDVDGSLSEAALLVTPYSGYEDPVIVNIAGDQWSIRSAPGKSAAIHPWGSLNANLMLPLPSRPQPSFRNVPVPNAGMLSLPSVKRTPKSAY